MSACVDASLVLKLLCHEEGSDHALQWMRTRLDEAIISPEFMVVEVASVLRHKVRRGEISDEHCAIALRLLDSLGVRYAAANDLLQRAMEMSSELDQSTIYGTVYLALAEREHCELWTVDEKFHGGASARYPFVKCLVDGDSK